MVTPINIFIAYAREDKSYLEELRRHMRILERQEDTRIWYDGEIVAGQKWNEVIEAELEKADLFLILLSADFLNSEYAYTKEMTQALARHERGEAVVIPIVVRACAWKYTPLATLQAPVEGKALASVNGGKRDELYIEIVNAIAKAADDYRQQKDKHQRYFADEAAWKEALQLNSINGFQRYLAQHPTGGHAAEAKKAIADLTGQVYNPPPPRRLFLSLIAIVAFVGIFAIIWSKSQPLNEGKDKITSDFPVPEMVFVPGGTFTMGCQDGRDENCREDEKPAHPVRLNDFYIGKYEVTVREFAAFIEATNYQTDADKNGGSYLWTGSEWKLKDSVNWKCDRAGNIRPNSEYNHPVIYVSWNDAIAYCKWLSEKTNKNYCLPTEAQWEYAARGGKQSSHYQYAGSNNIDEVAWYSGNAGGTTHRVGTKRANELGVYDMTGNVWEWCNDWYDGAYYSSSPLQNPTGAPTGSYRAVRGGSWVNDADNCRSSFRVRLNPIGSVNNIGFRVVRC